MATTEQIKALIRSHLEHDDERFLALALQVAAHSARQGHGRVAEDIKGLVDEARLKAAARPGHRPVAITSPKGELAGLLAVAMPRTRLSEMVLEPAIREKLDRVLREHRATEKLHRHGLVPARKLLLVGPPGSGKTMSAAALAGELGLPLYVIVLHTLITRFMGETAAKLRLVFDAIADTRGVYLFDEFDAIGAERASTNDVGEIRRVLNSFLQVLEQDESSSVIVAATNHPQALDGALFRRFDLVIGYELPTPDLAEEAVRNRLAPFATRRVRWPQIRQAAAGLSYADLAAACDVAAKETVLEDSRSITTGRLVSALTERGRGRRRA